ncbi:MAG: hypothetical protein STSR0008_09790 [Ignavibacterium sp.]
MKKLLISYFIILFTTLGFSQVDRSKQPKAEPAPTIKIAEYQSFELKNGLKVFVIENHKLPVVSFNLVIDRDPILEKENAGYIEAAGLLLKTGTTKRTKAQIDEEIDFIGASLSTSSSGIYGNSLKKHFEKLMEITSDIILNANFKKEELDKIKQQMKSSILASKDSPGYISNVVSKKIYYGESHPYSESETEKTIDNITLDLCNSYYKTFFKPNITYLSIVGDINLKEAKLLVEKYLSEWKIGEVPKYQYEKPQLPLVTKVALIDRPTSIQSTIRIGYPVDFSLNSSDYFQANLMNTILGGGTFRLFNNLREKHGFTYGAYSVLAHDKLIGRFAAYADVRNEVTDSAITEIIYEMERLKNEAVPDSEIQMAKNYLTGNFALSLENSQTIANFAINTTRYNLPKDFYSNYLKNLNSVTAEGIKQAAEKYILPNNAYILVVGKASDIEDKIKNFSVSKLEYYDVDGNKIDPSLSQIPADVTADKVIENYVTAIGGIENLKKIQDITISMNAEVQGLPIKIVIYQKAPNKFLQELNFAGQEMKTLFDGEKGYSIMGPNSQELQADQLDLLKAESNLDFFIDLKQYNVKTKIVGLEKINDKDAYKIEFTFPSGATTIMYFDKETGFKVRDMRSLNTPQGTMNITTDYDNYQEVSGVKYPFKLIQDVGIARFDMSVSDLNVNTGLSDNLFINQK